MAEGEKKQGIGDVAKQAIRDGSTNEEALEAVREAFPEGKTSLASMNWYRNNLRKEDPTVPSARELKKARKKARKEAGEKADPLD